MSKCLSPRDTLKESADNCRRNGCWRVNGNYQSVNGVNDGILLAFDATGNENVIYQQLFNNVGPALYVRRYWFNGWSDWVNIATKSDLSDRAKKLSANFIPGNTVLDFSEWSTITLLSIVTYKDEATALYLIRKESSNKIYCIPVKSSTQVSVTHNGENKLILTNSATYGGTYTVLFLS